MPVKLTSLCHGGGCGCKIAPAVLSQWLSASPLHALIPRTPDALMVGRDTADDAAVYRLNEHQALILTTDFFLPVVDDPFDFGAISATNAISDVYAMGGQPIMALAVVGMPIKQLSNEDIKAVLQGGESICAKAGIPIAGGHSIDSAEPFYGLVVAGLAHPSHIRRNATARAGDRLILCKPLGVGIYSAALRRGILTESDYRDFLATTTRLNDLGMWLGEQESVHALTDVTGFGLPGHLLEICRGSGVSAKVSWGALPWLPQALKWAQEGHLTGASTRNWQSYGAAINPAFAWADWQRLAFCDPQTSGGLLISADANAVAVIQQSAKKQGFIAVEIGEIQLKEGSSAITLVD